MGVAVGAASTTSPILFALFSVNHRLPAPSLAACVGSPETSKVVPTWSVGEKRKSWCDWFWVNHRFPSLPAAAWNGEPVAGYSVMPFDVCWVTAAGSMLATSPSPNSATQRWPSGPSTMPFGDVKAVGRS